MLYYGQGGDRDLVKARAYLKSAVASGQSEAAELLKEVEGKIKKIETESTRALRECVRQKRSSYDKNIINYINVCNKPINANICKQKSAGLIIGLFSGKEPEWTCKYKTVQSGKLIDYLYDADSNSSLLRMAITDAFNKIMVCYAPARPVSEGRAVQR